MMPVVTVWLKPKGEPTAMTSSPTLSLPLSALAERRIARVVNLDDRHVRPLVGSHHRCLDFHAVVERDFDLFAVFHHVVVGQDVTAVVIDES